MKMPANPFTAALRAGTGQAGLWVSLADPLAASAVATAGFDWVVIDCEHAPTELKDVMTILSVFEAVGTTAIVRPAWNDAVAVKRLLDLGAPGLLVPMVQSAEEARAAVAATRYPPRGVRGVAGNTRANHFGRISDYYDRVEEELTVIVQVETAAALACAEDIAAVDGVTGVFFGPADIGHLGKPTAKPVWDVILPVAQRLMARGVPVGTLVPDVKLAAELMNAGFAFVACGTDAAILARGADAALAQMKEQTGKA